MRNLPSKQRVFVEEYLSCWNAAEAARRAGYSKKSARSIGQELLTKPDIAAAIQERISQKAMTADEVLLRLAEQARANLRPFLRVSDAGEILGFTLSDDTPVHLLKEVSLTETEFNDVTKRTVSIKLNDPQAALVHLGKHHKLFTEHVNLSGDLAVKTYQVISPEDWDDAGDAAPETDAGSV